MSRAPLAATCLAALGTMLGLTIAASLDCAIWEAGRALWPDPWFRATLADAYLAFLASWLWVVLRERGWGTRLLWLAAFLCLGSIGIVSYLLLALRRLEPGQPLSALLRPVAPRPGA